MSVLIVEDDEGVRESLETLLRDEGYDVETARDGAAALERLDAGETPSLILLDLNMPGMDGIEFRHRQLADSRWREIPVIVLSARPDGDKRATELGAVDYLAKPMSFESLLFAVQNRAITVVSSVDLPPRAKTLCEAWQSVHTSALDDRAATVGAELDSADSSPTR